MAEQERLKKERALTERQKHLQKQKQQEYRRKVEQELLLGNAANEQAKQRKERGDKIKALRERQGLWAREDDSAQIRIKEKELAQEYREKIMGRNVLDYEAKKREVPT